MIKNNLNFSKITTTVVAHKKLWAGIKEGNTKAKPMLDKYWTAVRGKTYTQAQYSSVTWQNANPWSAAYISYIVLTADSSFPKSAAHRVYATAALENRNTSKSNSWKLYSVARELEPILCQVGDVLVGGRSGDYNNSHGDVVWKVDSSKKKAYLAGGNLGDTNSTSINIDLNSNLSYSPAKTKGYNGLYYVVLKKMP